MYHFTIGLFIAVIISMVINVANAAETRPYMYRVQQTLQLQELINRGSVPVTYETVATTPAGQQVTRYTARPTPLTTARLGSLARSATGGPAVLAATAAFLAYDYFYNDDTQEWEVSPVFPDDYDTAVSNAQCFVSAGNVQPYSNLSDCVAAISSSITAPFAPYRVRRSLNNPPLQVDYCVDSINVNTQVVFNCPNGNRWTVQSPPQFVTSWPSVISINPSPATDDQLGDAVKNAPPQAVSDILNDPITTGTWPDRWPEMVPTVQDVEDQLAHDIEGAPAPVNPDQTITDGSTARPSDSGSGSGSGDLELPSFCDWVPDWLCDVMDLPEHPDVPFVDIDEPDSFVSGIGAGQCPADNVIVTQFGSVPISWALPCQLAETFRPVVLFFAWITALYIVVRIK